MMLVVVVVVVVMVVVAKVVVTDLYRQSVCESCRAAAGSWVGAVPVHDFRRKG